MSNTGGSTGRSSKWLGRFSTPMSIAAAVVVVAAVAVGATVLLAGPDPQQPVVPAPVSVSATTTGAKTGEPAVSATGLATPPVGTSAVPATAAAGLGAAEVIGRWLLTTVDLHDGAGAVNVAEAHCFATFTGTWFTIDFQDFPRTFRNAKYRISHDPTDLVHFQEMAFSQSVDAFPPSDVGGLADIAVENFGAVRGPADISLTGDRLTIHLQSRYRTPNELETDQAVNGPVRDRTFVFSYAGPPPATT